MNTLIWAVSTSVNVTIKEKQHAVIGSLLLVVFLINNFFLLLVSMVPKTSFGMLCMSLRQIVNRTTKEVWKSYCRNFTVLVWGWGWVCVD